jgi:D-alanyl-D-alanine carboxypeptidase
VRPDFVQGIVGRMIGVARSGWAWGGVAWILSCGACAAAGESPAHSPAQPVAERAPPEPSPLERELDALLRLTERGEGLAGMSVAVLYKGRPVLTRAYGMADVVGNRPLASDGVFRIGSITKTFTAAAILKLAAQGKLTLGDPILSYVPELQHGQDVTLRHLLSHTSGIRSFTAAPWYDAHMAQPLTHAALVAKLDQPLEFAPGSRYSYSNSGYYLLGLVIEKASGSSYVEFLQRELFQPAGLTSTRYCPDEPSSEHDAHGYANNGGTLEPAKPISMTLPYAAGALCSSAGDLVRWMQALQTGKVIGAAGFSAMSEPTPLPEGRSSAYALGLQRGELAGHARLGHGGGINGFVSDLTSYPADDLYIAVLVNTAGVSAGAISEKIARVVLGVKEAPLVDLEVSAEEAAPLVGTYDISELGQVIAITFEQGVLRLGRVGTPRSRKMFSQGEGVYVVPEIGARVSFELEGDQAKRMVVLQRGSRFVGERK